MAKTYIFTGGYTQDITLGSGETVPASCPGIVCYEWDSEKEQLTKLPGAAPAANPSWVVADPQGPYVYCVNELKEIGGISGASVSAYRIDPETMQLTLLNRQFTTGEDTCHLTLTEDGAYLLAANFTGGSFCVFPILEDHSLGSMTNLIKHKGHGVNAQRQGSPHPHQTILAPDGKHVYVSDLGLDTLVSYDFDREHGWLLETDFPNISGKPGQGTRHGVFNAAGDRLYVATEMSCEVNVYSYEKETGEAKLIQTLSAMGDRVGERPLGAAIRLHPDGKQLYSSVRGSDHLAVFEILEDGTLVLKQTIESGGKIPRDFIITPDREHILAGNQDSDSIGVFRIEKETGRLTLLQIVENAGGVITLSPWLGDEMV